LVATAKGLGVGIDATSAMKPERSGVAHYVQHLVHALAVAALPHDHFALCYRMSGLGRRAHRVPLPHGNFSQHWMQGGLHPRGLRIAHGPDGRLFEMGSAGRVVTIHDVFALEDGAEGTDDWRAKMAERYRAVAERADLILCVSAWTRNRFLNHFPEVDVKRVRVVPPGVTPAFSPQAGKDVPAVRQLFGIEGPYALFLGVLNRRKNPGVLLDAWARLPEEAGGLVLAGADGGLLEPLREYAQELGLAARVHFAGHVDDVYVPALIAGATCLVVPSRLEGFGLPALEALACGTPVVHSGRGGLREAAGMQGIEVDPEDPEAIAAAVLRTIDDMSTRDRMVEGGLAYAARFDWLATARLTLQAYREVNLLR
jgi:glycosyltransferase involved in cell wall biosynthesis